MANESGSVLKLTVALEDDEDAGVKLGESVFAGELDGANVFVRINREEKTLTLFELSSLLGVVLGEVELVPDTVPVVPVGPRADVFGNPLPAPAAPVAPSSPGRFVGGGFVAVLTAEGLRVSAQAQDSALDAASLFTA